MIITKIFIYHFRDKSPRCGKGKPTQYLHVCLILPTTSKSLSLGQIQWALVFFISQTDLSPLNTLTDSSTFVSQSTTSNCEKLVQTLHSDISFLLTPPHFLRKGLLYAWHRLHSVDKDSLLWASCHHLPMTGTTCTGLESDPEPQAMLGKHLSYARTTAQALTFCLGLHSSPRLQPYI